MSNLHPLSFLLLALWFSTAAILAPSPFHLALVLLLVVVVSVLLTRSSISLSPRQLLGTLSLCLAVLAVQLMFVKTGSLIWGRGWYALHSEGLRRGIAFCLRLLILFVSARLLLKLDYEDFDAAFAALRFPEELAFMVFYSLHILPLSRRKIAKSRQLLRLRGLDLAKLAWRRKLMIYSRVSLSLLADVLSTSGIQAIALELRGFRSSGKRTRLNRRRFSWRDALALLPPLALTAVYFA